MSHQDFISCLTTYYETLVALQYIKSSHVIKPPRNGHTNVDAEAAREQGFGDEMISLVRELPYLSVDCEDLAILPDGTKPRSYLDDDFLDWARDPLFQGSPMVKSTQIVLTNPAKSGIVLIYDMETCECISWSTSEKGSDYDSLPSCAPKELLGQWTEKLLNLEWIPYRESTGWGLILRQPPAQELERAVASAESCGKHQTLLVQLGIKKVYMAAGWSVDAQTLEDATMKFDGLAFEGRSKAWKTTTQGLLDTAHREGWKWSKTRALLQIPPATASILDAGDDNAGKRLRI
ncbi:hypothetical protein AAFC00_000501 [Neodothiora populina]|uniref:Uncharacterized protein n=1 Tax=Neodothiora populina TaxID=2781224 RepID=A0ABR3PD60_9PEZI